jgi:hypothetical protein
LLLLQLQFEIPDLIDNSTESVTFASGGVLAIAATMIQIALLVKFRRGELIKQQRLWLKTTVELQSFASFRISFDKRRLKARD